MRKQVNDREWGEGIYFLHHLMEDYSCDDLDLLQGMDFMLSCTYKHLGAFTGD